MNNKKLIVLGLLLSLFLFFTTCENSVMRPWWEDEPDYFGITKNIPYNEFIYETIFEHLPPSATAQNIEIINIEFILFSGDQIEYNEGPNGTAVSALSEPEKKSNEANIFAMAEELFVHNDYMIILHGHANPVNNTEQEKAELEMISKTRAAEVEKRLVDMYNVQDNVPPDPPLLPSIPRTLHDSDNHDLDDRVFVRGYGGGRNLGSTTYAGLNRRVEMILFRISITEVPYNDKEN